MFLGCISWLLIEPYSFTPCFFVPVLIVLKPSSIKKHVWLTVIKHVFFIDLMWVLFLLNHIIKVI